MRALAAILLVACGGADGAQPGVDGNPSDSPPPGCQVGITYMPQTPVASPDTKIRAVGHVTGSSFGAPELTWFLSIGGGPNITPPAALPDNSEVEFIADQDATYHLRFRVTDPNCDEAVRDIDVNAPGVGQTNMRLHVVAPDSANRAPVDETVIVKGGASHLLANTLLDPTSAVTGTVELGGSGVAAYLELSPGGSPDATTDAFANGAGTFTTKLAAVSQNVRVVPTSQSIPPQLVTLPVGGTTVSLDAGIPLSGTVKDSGSIGIMGATVQLVIGGLPTTIGTTDNTGAFTVHAIQPVAGANVHVEVTPPAVTGLPRLVTDSTMLDLSNPVAIKYAAITTRNLAGTVIQRGGPLLGANVSVVGTLASAGTVTAGVAVGATGEVRQTAVTSGTTGALPTLRAPAIPLSAVIFPATAGDHAVTAIDLTTAVPATITAAATTAKTTRISNVPNTAGLPGAVLDAVPIGPLALAGAPTIRKIANAAGQVTVDLAPGGDYAFRLWDPNGNRGALFIPTGTTPAALVAQMPLADLTLVTGTILGDTNPIPGAIVQFMCSSCTGLERDRPIAEGLTGVDGTFSLAVPDPN